MLHKYFAVHKKIKNKKDQNKLIDDGLSFGVHPKQKVKNYTCFEKNVLIPRFFLVVKKNYMSC